MKKDDVLLFIGDSITEWGRNGSPEDIGTGYVRLIHDYLVTTYPKQKPVVLNRGVGGDQITNLEERWESDVISLQPSYVSISIGINDVWSRIDEDEEVQVHLRRFESIYVDLLNQVKEKTSAKIIIMEPTIIEEDINSKGNQKLLPYVQTIQKLAEKFDAVYVPTHQAFIDYLQSQPDYELTNDGVHMNPAGNMLMAMTWIKAFEADMSRGN